MQQTRAAPATLEAVLERITYANPDTGYTVARVATNRSADLQTVVGPLLGAQPGESLRLQGRWASHPQYGPWGAEIQALPVSWRFGAA
jgi:exodeoxyribonuclease V alpha subunit